MVTIALTHVLQEGPLPQHLVSLGVTFCVDQCQSDWVGSYFLHQLQLLMSVHFEKKKLRLKGPTLVLIFSSFYRKCNKFQCSRHWWGWGWSDSKSWVKFLHNETQPKNLAQKATNSPSEARLT